MFFGVTQDVLALPGLSDERKDMEMIQSEWKILPSYLMASRSRGSMPQAAVGGEPKLQEVAKEAPVTTLAERDTEPSRRAREASEEKVGRSNCMFVFLKH